MQRDGIRCCDVCGDHIPRHTLFQVYNLRPEAAELLSEVEDPDLRATFTQNPDGTVRLDVCSVCTLSMGSTPSREEMN